MSLLDSILIGVSYAAIPGPVFLELARRTLTKGFLHGFLLAVGEFFANFLIIAIGYFGFSLFLSMPLMKPAMLAISGAILLWIAYSAMKFKGKLSGAHHTGGSSVGVGFALGISNPIGAAFWVSVGGTYLAQSAPAILPLVEMASMAFGVVLFFLVLASILHRTRHMVSPVQISWLSKVAGAILGFYGLYFLYQSAIAIS